MDERLSRVFGSVFGVTEIDDAISTTSLPEWDSLAHVTLIVELEQAFGVSISSVEAAELTSVSTIRALLARKGVT